MKMTARSTLSATAGLGLTAFTAISFAAAGIAAPATVLGISFLTVFALFEIAALDYSPVAVRRVRLASAAARSGAVRGEVVRFPVGSCCRGVA